MNRRLIRIVLVTICAIVTGGFPGRSIISAPATQSGPTLLKASVIVRANRLLHYWKGPEQDNYWSWMPEMSFYVTGPINTGSAFVIDFTNEAGAPWYSVECETNAIPAGQFAHIVTPAITTHVDKRTTLATGTFGFTIRLKSELSGTNEKFFSGKFKVTRFHIGNNLPAFKNQFEYVVDIETGNQNVIEGTDHADQSSPANLLRQRIGVDGNDHDSGADSGAASGADPGGTPARDRSRTRTTSARSQTRGQVDGRPRTRQEH
jgi:hypothetical protein